MSKTARIDETGPQRTEPRTMRRSRWAAATLCMLGAALVLTLSGCTLWTVRSLHPAAGTETAGSIVPGQPGFDPVGYVNSIWASKVVPTVDESATDLQTLLTALKADPA